MARGSDLLTAMKTKAAKEPVFYLGGKPLTAPGHYRDGKGLYLQISVWGTKSFVFRYTINGKMRGTIKIAKDADKETAIAAAKEAVADKLTGNIVKEIYVPGRIVNIVQK